MGVNVINYAMGRKDTSETVASALTGVSTMEADNDLGMLKITMNDGGSVSLTPPTTPGKSLEYKWEGTKLGVRVEGEENYIFTDLKGEAGNTTNISTTMATDSDIANMFL